MRVSTTTSRASSSRADAVAGAAAIFTCAIGSIVLLGWLLDAGALKRGIPLPGFITIEANIGISFALAGIALWLLRREGANGATLWAGRACAAVLALIGLGSLGWMAAPTATAFMLLGVALVLFDVEIRERYRLANGLAGLIGGGGLLVLIGYATDVNTLPGLSSTWMAQMTATTFIVVSAGVLVARPQRGIVRLLSSPGPGGVAARRLLPMAVTLPVLLGFLRLHAQQDGIVSLEVGVWLMIVCMVVTFAVPILVLASSLERGDRQRRRAEEATREAKVEAERANQANSEYLSRMSHELRTPLNAVLGFGQLLELQCTDVHQVEGVRQILNGGRHLLGMIDTILDISRIEAGSMALSLEPVHAGGVITDALELVAPLAAERGIRIDARHGAGADRHVRADMQRLKQVLLNLLANGVKYNREGGTISIAAEEIAGERLRILVSDTGPGIAAEQLDNVFVPFQRLGAERTSVEGTGLGLALSKRLIEAMDGTLGVTSEPGHGSTFWVDLAVETSVPEPPLEPAGVQGDGDALSIRRGRARSVLYIEDNLSNVKLLEQLFAKRPDVRLIPSMQGNLGLALAQEHRPDMILLDLHLPDLHGAEVLRRLKANPATAQTPVVIVSADATPGQIQRLLAAGAHAYLTKPLDVRQLLALVDDILWTSEAAMR